MIRLANGELFDLYNPDPDLIDVETIASSLSKLCRYGGHCPKFYSVAQHSVIAARLAEYEGEPTRVVKSVLLHDAAEAFVGDMVSPLKITMPDYREVESKIATVIESKFDVKFDQNVHLYDIRAAKLEMSAFWPAKYGRPGDPTVVCWTHGYAKFKFLQLWEYLCKSE